VLLWIFLGAPFIEVMRGNKALAGALPAITAAVVGVVLNLAIWFAIHTVFRAVRPLRPIASASTRRCWPASIPGRSRSRWPPVLRFSLKVGMIPVLAACSAAGILLYLAGAVA
jgi:chromate transporter